MRLRATVLTTWMPDWNSSGQRIGLLFGPWYVPNVTLLQCRMPHAEQRHSMKQSRVRKVATACTCWRKRTSPWQPPETHHQSQSQSTSSKRSKISTQQTQNLQLPRRPLVSDLFLPDVAELIPTTLRKMPRLSESGPLGMRAEHWYDFGSLAGDSDLFVQVELRHIATASVPQSVSTVSQGPTAHATRQTHGRAQTTSHDVLSPQTRSQISRWLPRRNQLPDVRDL